MGVYLRGDGVDFNPLASERRDHIGVLVRDLKHISIHSPLRGETIARRGASHSTAHFNPLASERRDAYGRMTQFDLKKFQSTRL